MSKNIPYTYPHKSRAAKVDYICGIGGYYSNNGRFPIEFNVGAYYADFAFDHIWKTHSSEHIPEECKQDPLLMARYYALAKRLHAEHEGHLWDWGQEDACHSLHEGAMYSMLWDGTEVDVTLELHGRCGKHLVIAEYNGTTLRGMSDDALHDLLMLQTDNYGEEVCNSCKLLRGYSWAWSASQLDTLYRYVRQCEVDFTQEKASAEIEYQGAFCFFANIVSSAWEEEKRTIEEHDAVVGCAQCLRRYLEEREGVAVMQMLSTLSRAAGVTEEEIEGGY